MGDRIHACVLGGAGALSAIAPACYPPRSSQSSNDLEVGTQVRMFEWDCGSVGSPPSTQTARPLAPYHTRPQPPLGGRLIVWLHRSTKKLDAFHNLARAEPGACRLSLRTGKAGARLPGTMASSRPQPDFCCAHWNPYRAQPALTLAPRDVNSRHVVNAVGVYNICPLAHACPVTPN